MNYDNIKSHKKPGFHPLFRRYLFGNTTGGGQYVKRYSISVTRKAAVMYTFAVCVITSQYE